MINASKEFRETIKSRTDFIETAKITFKDGRVLNLTQDDFTISGNTVSDAAGASSFPLGVAVGKIIQIEIFNDNDHLSSYDFYGAVIDLRLSLELSESTEILNYGTYTVIEPETYGETVIVQAMDNMYKTDKNYSTNLPFPVTLGAAVMDSAQSCGLSLLKTTFKNADFMIQQAPEGITHRQFLAMAAMIACGYARIDYNGYLCIVSYDFSAFNEGTADLDGGVFDADTPYSTGDDADGGTFNPWSAGYEYDSGLFSKMADYHVFYDFGTLTVATDDAVVTGIETTVNDTRYLAGSEGYTLNIENQLITGQEQAAVSLIAQSIVGIRFRPFEGEHVAYPLAEFGDLAYVIDRKNNAYQTILTDVDFEFNNVTRFKCSADSPLRNSSKYASQLTQAVVTARKETEQQISQYDQTVQMMTNIIANGMGLFPTREQTENGGYIIYLHNKPLKEDSDIIWRINEQGFQVSTDGGDTWNAGMDANGNVAVNVLSAIGINFNWAKGGTLTLGGSGNGNGLLKILNASGAEIGYIDNSGTHFYQGEITTEDEGRGTSVSGGRIKFKKNETLTGGISPIAWANDYENAEGVMFHTDSEYLSLAYMASDGYVAGYAMNNGLNPNGHIEKHIFYGSARFRNVIRFGETNTANVLAAKLANGNDAVGITNGGLYLTGDLACEGTKNRVVDTKNYGKVGMNAIESATPYFSDIGSGIVGDGGEITIFFDPIFAETIELNTEYQVFITQTSEGNIKWTKKDEGYFTVYGTEGTSFDWMICAKQKYYTMNRMESIDLETNDYIEFDESVFRWDDKPIIALEREGQYD